MDDKVIKLKGGVLIIGSLLWQDHLNEPGDNIRKDWRDRFLNESEKIMIKVPIRYGRLSRSNIYTMTFSNALKRKMGTAFLVPFRNQFSSIPQIIEDAREMSEAEGMGRRFVAGENIWSVMGISINPKLNKSPLKKEIISKWFRSIEKPFDMKDFRIGREKPCLKATGELDIPWLNAVDSRNAKNINEFDFYIATVTKPTNYPPSKELSLKVKGDNQRYYFIENFKSGITTFQDHQVINLI